MTDDITRALKEVAGDQQKLEAVLPAVYAELKGMARRRIAQESDVITMGATGLLHEAYLRMAGGKAGFDNRAHFFAAAGEAMRRILVERARALAAVKRGQRPTRISLDDQAGLAGSVPAAADAIDLMALDSALTDLEGVDPAMATVVKLRYFGGLTVDETAQALTVSPRSVNRAWRAARVWLKVQLEDG
ncbi:MAG: ECF-type sigma factor [Pseudomonadota bacterium]